MRERDDRPQAAFRAAFQHDIAAMSTHHTARRCHLIENAIVYGKAAEVFAPPRGHGVLITIDDHGRAFRKPTATGCSVPSSPGGFAQPGIGGRRAGLAIARSVVVLNGGDIVLESRRKAACGRSSLSRI